MATRYWDRGAADGDWQNATNWSADTKPLANDTVIFDNHSVVGPDEGMLDSESGAAAECTYDLLHVKTSFTGDIAAAAEPCCCSPDRLIIEGPGEFHFLVGKDDQSTDTNVGIVIINNPSATVYLYSNANDGANTCGFTKVYLIAGTLHVAHYDEDTDNTGCWIPDLYVMPRKGSLNNANVYIEEDAYKANGWDADTLTNAMNIYLQTGTLTTDSAIQNCLMYNGVINYGTDGAAETDMNILNLQLMNGRFLWQPDDAGAPCIKNARFYGGLFDASSSVNSNMAKVLGGGAGKDIYSYEGATVKLDNGMSNTTIAASSQWFDFGADIDFGGNVEIGITNDPT